VTNEDTEESVTLVVNGSVTALANQRMTLVLYQATGEPKLKPNAVVAGAGVVALDVVSNPIPTITNGTTNFSVALLNASTEGEITRTTTRPSVVGYTGGVRQNSTSGQVRVSIPRDVLPRSATTSLTIWPGYVGKYSGGNQSTEIPMSYDSGTDEFTAVIEASEFESTDYAWRTSVTSNQYKILTFASHFITSGNITIESSNNSGNFDGAAAQYNTDDNSKISISELGTAASDYAQGNLTIIQLGNVASVYARS